MAILYIFGAGFLLVGLGILVRQARLRRLHRQRGGTEFARERFINDFRRAGTPDNIPAAVHDYYSSKKYLKSFALSPEDKYSVVLADDPIDIESDARRLIERLGLTYPPEYFLREWGGYREIKTLRDMVVWLDWVRQHQPSEGRNESSQP